MNNNEKKKRAAKTTQRQYDIYLEELRINQPFRENKLDATQPNIIEDSWQNLCEKLNASGGPVKSVQEWKRVFTYWKSQVKSKAREFKVAQRETGNKENKAKPLNDLENKLLDIIGRVVVDGMSGIAQFGIADNGERQTAHIQEIRSTESNCDSLANLKATEETNIYMLDINDQNNHESVEAVSKKKIVTNKTNEKRVNIDNEFVEKQTPKKKTKSLSLTGCLRDILDNKVKETEESQVLNEICNQLKNIEKLQTKSLQLERLKMQVKYPDHVFILSSDSE